MAIAPKVWATQLLEVLLPGDLAAKSDESSLKGGTPNEGLPNRHQRHPQSNDKGLNSQARPWPLRTMSRHHSPLLVDFPMVWENITAWAHRIKRTKPGWDHLSLATCVPARTLFGGVKE